MDKSAEFLDKNGMSCLLCDADDLKHTVLLLVKELYDKSHEWVDLKECPTCRKSFLIYGVELCRVSGPDRDEDDIYSYAVPVSDEEIQQLLSIRWEKDMLSWENNTAKRLVLSRRHHVIDYDLSSYWSDSSSELGLGILPPG